MSVQVNENNRVRHDGAVYEAGKIIHNLEEEAKAELVRLGVVRDLEVAEQVLEPHAAAPAAPMTTTVVEPKVAGSVADHVAEDVAAAEALAAAPGQPASVPGQPTAEEVAPTADNVE